MPLFVLFLCCIPALTLRVPAFNFYFEYLRLLAPYFFLPAIIFICRKKELWQRGLLSKFFLCLALALQLSVLIKLVDFIFISPAKTKYASSLANEIRVVIVDIQYISQEQCVINDLKARKADVVIVTGEAAANIKVALDFPTKRQIRTTSETTLLLSNFALNSEPTTFLGDDMRPSAQFELLTSANKTLKVAVVDKLEVLSQQNFLTKRNLLRRLTTKMRHFDGQGLILGDLQLSIFSGWYGLFAEFGAGMRSLASSGTTSFTLRLLEALGMNQQQVFYKGLVLIPTTKTRGNICQNTFLTEFEFE